MMFEERSLELSKKIEKGHDYRFVGKVGCFCPILPGNGAGILLRKNDRNGKYYAANDTKKRDESGVYRWMEDEMVKTLGLEDRIDCSYYNDLANAAIEEISKYGSFERFVSEEETPEWMYIPNTNEEELPFPMNEPE